MVFNDGRDFDWRRQTSSWIFPISDYLTPQQKRNKKKKWAEKKINATLENVWVGSSKSPGTRACAAASLHLALRKGIGHFSRRISKTVNELLKKDKYNNRCEKKKGK